ncbi:diguanylate cyclase [Chrysiogenes arsenatis]|uniref:diguanylate cyclase n=1 Tax=Chrysiogenes arsenatis TaxID=309797 RepID=UPI0004269AB8|nr:diguanylate cyclase [Chrysiogenes arsenatis]
MKLDEFTILIVDDEPTNIEVLTRTLSQDYHIISATDGRKALQIALSDEQPDLILLDVMMPGMSGYDICRRLKSDNRTMNIPIIFVTACDDRESEETGLELGAVDYITRPFHVPVVRARVRNHVNMQRKTMLLEKLSLIDGLTHIPNRRRFDNSYEQEWRRAMRYNKPVSLVMIDIDNFKAYNDIRGHSDGDECLRRVAEALSNVLLRGSDMVARYGGEEFIALLPDTQINGAVQVSEKLRAAVEAMEIPHPDSSVSPFVTVSIGHATCLPNFRISRLEFLQAADQALYSAKEAGRNQVYGMTTLWGNSDANRATTAMHDTDSIDDFSERAQRRNITTNP